MSVPSSYRSSSAAPLAKPEMRDLSPGDFVRSQESFRRLCDTADSESLLKLISSLYTQEAYPSTTLGMSDFKLIQARFFETFDIEEFSETSDAFINVFCDIILKSDKLDPVLTKMLQQVVRSQQSFDEKKSQITQLCVMNDYCDSSVAAAQSLPVDIRIATIYSLLDEEKNNPLYRRFEKELAIEEKSFLEIAKDNGVARSDDERSTQFRNLLASRIAATISDDFAKNLGEEIDAGSHLNRIKSVLETELVKQRGNSSSGALSESTGSPEQVDSYPQFWAHDSGIVPGFQNTSSPSSTAHLTTTTAATATTTTTTSTLPVTTTTNTTSTHTTNTMTTPASVKTHSGNSGISAESLSKNSGQQILADFGYPLSLQKKNSRKWKEAAKLVEKFYKHCAPQPGSRRELLMQLRASALKDSTNALSVISLISKKGKDVGARLAFEKNISPNTDKALSKAILGHSEGYAQRHPELLAGSSPVSTSTTVDMIRPDGTIVTPTVVCVSSPALGKNGAELATYLLPDGRLNTDLYAKARQAITDQVIVNVRSLNANNERKRVVLSAAGMGEFIAGLSKEDAARASRLAAGEMANLIIQLGKDKVSVVYTDKDDQGAFWKQVNDNLDEGATAAFVGALPGNWVDDNDLIVNSTSGFYQPGHGGQAGKSLDGQFGDTLLFDAHMLRSIFHSVGLRPADLAE